ncbi:MAG: T9SS type A sorting domain-containing protein [Fluviicola sp.]|nr:T9SS type A sorting domain-containing protein [Fluviicola sp.]
MMKNNLLLNGLLTVLLTFIGTLSFGQGFTLTSLYTNNNQLAECDTMVDINIAALTAPSTNADFNLALFGSSFTASQFTTTVNWGDGNTTTHVGGTSSAGVAIPFAPPIQHYYANNGTYTIYVAVLNPQNNSFASDTLYYTQTTCNSYLFSSVILDCDNDGNTDSTLANGVPITLYEPGGMWYSGTLNNGSVNYNNVLSGTYTISISQTWLNQNGYVIESVTPSTITISPNMQTFTTQIVLNCDSIPNADNLCLYGMAFCDGDSNGVYNAGETPIVNAPVQIMNGGQTMTVYTNSGGYYSVSYSGTVGSPTIISINPNWLAQNGYTMNSNPFTVLAADCNSQPVANIPVNCNGGNNNPYQCVAAIVFCDANGNGSMDNGETPLQNAPITLWGQQNQNVIIYTDSNGYAMYCGNNISLQVIAQLNQAWLTQHGYTISNPIITLLASGSQTPNPGYFAVNCGGGGQGQCADLWTTVTPWIGYYQNTTAYIKLNYGNYGPGAPGPYTLTMTFPAGVTVNTSSLNPGYTINGNTITWTLNSNLTSFSTYDLILFNVPSGIPNGTVHQFTSTITPTGNVSDCCTSNNNGCLVQIVGNSYDPNDKMVDHVEQIAPSVQDELTYTVRFQNTGTAPAQNIYILDTLSANLDWSTFELIEASHAMHVDDLGNGVLRFNFPQIWLPDSTTNEAESHGHLVYRLKENAANTEGTEIFNTAYIFFDWNDPIITNTTYNINTSLGLTETSVQGVVFPNPFQQEVTIRAKSMIQTVVVSDLSGKVLLTQAANSNELKLDLSNYSSGVYMVMIQTQSGAETHRIVKK